jgi:hypothetical protein
MNRAWTRYGILLTYADRLSDFDPSAYEKHFKDADKSKLTEIEKRYKKLDISETRSGDYLERQSLAMAEWDLLDGQISN